MLLFAHAVARHCSKDSSKNSSKDSSEKRRYHHHLHLLHPCVVKRVVKRAVKRVASPSLCQPTQKKTPRNVNTFCGCLVCMPCMYALYACLVCMPYMYALYVCLVFMRIYVHVWYVYLICMPTSAKYHREGSPSRRKCLHVFTQSSWELETQSSKERSKESSDQRSFQAGRRSQLWQTQRLANTTFHLSRQIQ